MDKETIHQKELTDEIVNLTGLKKSTVTLTLNTFLDLCDNHLYQNHQSLSFRGHGSLHVIKKNAQQRYIPSQNKTKTIPAHYRIVYSPANNKQDFLKIDDEDAQKP